MLQIPQIGWNVNYSQTLTGRFLAHNRLNLVKRAFLAAELYSVPSASWSPP